MKIALATVGTSKIAKQFVTAALETGRFTLCKVYSRAFQTGLDFGTQWGCGAVVTDLQQLAKDPEVQAVYIASPNGCHFTQSKMFLEAGKHVICEKTITTSPEEFLELQALAKSKNVIYMDAIMSAHAPGREPLKKALASIGKIAIARLDFTRISHRYEDFKKGETVNIFDMSLHAGALMDMGVYCVYAAVDLLGDPESIKAEAGFLRGGTDGSGVAIFHYPTFNAVLTYGKTSTSEIASEIMGEKGTLTIGSVSQYFNVVKVTEKGKEEVFGEIPKTQAMMGEASAFADYIEGRRPEDYKEKTELTEKVLRCMDKIKKDANIKYTSN